MPVKHSQDGKDRQLFHICLAPLSPIVVSAVWFDVRQRSSYFLHLRDERASDRIGKLCGRQSRRWKPKRFSKCAWRETIRVDQGSPAGCRSQRNECKKRLSGVGAGSRQRVCPEATEGVLFGARVWERSVKLWRVQMMLTENTLRGNGIHREFLVN